MRSSTTCGHGCSVRRGSGPHCAQRDESLPPLTLPSQFRRCGKRTPLLRQSLLVLPAMCAFSLPLSFPRSTYRPPSIPQVWNAYPSSEAIAASTTRDFDIPATAFRTLALQVLYKTWVHRLSPLNIMPLPTSTVDFRVSWLAQHKVVHGTLPLNKPFSKCHFIRCVYSQHSTPSRDTVALSDLPFNEFVDALPLHDAMRVVRFHGITIPDARRNINGVRQQATGHVCSRAVCRGIVYEFEVPMATQSPTVCDARTVPAFPPEPCTVDRMRAITCEWAQRISERSLRESPCAVCGCAALSVEMTHVALEDDRLSVLTLDHACQLEQSAFGWAPLPHRAVLCRKGIIETNGNLTAGCCRQCMQALGPVYSRRLQRML